MDVSSVKDRPVPPTQPPKRTEQVHSEAAKPRTTEAKKAPEAKQMPVVNSQGQTTGRHQPPQARWRNCRSATDTGAKSGLWLLTLCSSLLRRSIDAPCSSAQSGTLWLRDNKARET